MKQIYSLELSSYLHSIRTYYQRHDQYYWFFQYASRQLDWIVT